MNASKAARLKVVAEMGTDAIPTKRSRVSAMKDFKELYTSLQSLRSNTREQHPGQYEQKVHSQDVDYTTDVASLLTYQDSG